MVKKCSNCKFYSLPESDQCCLSCIASGCASNWQSNGIPEDLPKFINTLKEKEQALQLELKETKERSHELENLLDALSLVIVNLNKWGEAL